MTFATVVGDWVHTVEGALDVIFRESAQELVRQLDIELVDLVYDRPPAPSGYKRTGFLRASLVASLSVMPTLSRENPGTPVAPDYGEVVLAINAADAGETIYLGYTANYGAHVHYGANGRPGRPWVDLVAQRWVAIVERVSAEVKARLGL